MADWTEQYEHIKPLDDGTYLVMFPITFGRLRLAIAQDEWSLGEHW